MEIKYSVNTEKWRKIKVMYDKKIEVCIERKISRAEKSQIILRQEDILLEEFIVAVGKNGQGFSGALFNEEKECFEKQQVFGIYINNSISYQEFIERSKVYEILPAFIYKTIGKSGGFCAVYLAESIIMDLNIAELYNAMLLKIFPEAVWGYKGITRVFAGGNTIVYSEKNNRLCLQSLVRAFHMVLKNADSHNFKRNVENVARKYGIACKNGFLKIYDKNLVKNVPSNVMILENMVIEYGTIEKSVKSNSTDQKNSSIVGSAISGIDANKMKIYCPLYKDHIEKGVPYIHKLLLVTNLHKVKGGEKLFLKGIQENDEKKWKYIWKESKVYNYIPMECSEGKCPYKNTCQTRSLCLKLLKNVILLKTEESYSSIKVAGNELKQYLDKAIEEKKKKVCLIKAQTALGKTQAYCNLVTTRADQAYMIAVPSIMLQQEVFEALQSRGVNCIKTKSCIETAKELKLPICKELDLLYKCGLEDKVKGTLQKYKSEHINELSDEQNLRLEECLNQINRLDGSCCVVTTHNMILNLPAYILEKYEIIIDEDLLMSIFRDIGSVCVSKIQEAFRLKIFKDVAQERLIMLLNMPRDEVIKVGQGINSTISKEDMDEYGEIIKLLKSKIFYYDTKKKEIQYFNPRKIPDVKMTVLSATLNEKLWKDFCRDRIVEMKEVRQVKYLGRLLQYTNYSMSRKCIQENGYDNVRSRIVEMVGDKNIIIDTFKCLNENVAIHFGKTEGFDEYKGRDLVVLGTPHCTESLYKMVGSYLNYDTSRRLSRQRVENSNYSFVLMTFKDIDMRNLQMFLLESELEQAVGRARLLRYDCTVWVFSNFPLKQAQIIQDDYLKS